ncbi:hypothetical protein G7Z17_g1833 [Cylindrodendrum hubeiense]|uniref:FAD-binding domain-containing protein n=1 Tax=Cylindrodendrum hubeiense TaxID=595255 RepID=A0A9P5HM60_9HYPO|nr:hypothetical protein G7Z17_g1833 [Cylindrodendrum hubeiense]
MCYRRSMATKPRALIIGAGISGLSAAWWLDKAGWTSVIVERAPRLRDGGYLVTISGLGLETLMRMNLAKDLEGLTYKFEENVFNDNNGRELLRIRYKDVHGGVESLAVCRDDLARTLAKALPESASIRFNETLDHFYDDGSKIQATVKSGDIIEADLLIGADGIRSSVRNESWKDVDCLEHLGYSYAAYDFEKKDVLKSDCVSFNGPGHLDMLYALRNDRVAALHIWRDDMMKPKDEENNFEIVRHVTAGSVKLVADVIDGAEESGSSPIMDRLTMVTLPKWSKGRIVLLGDAAHCLTLMSAQGACMALASTEILGKELMATKDISQALDNHERKLRPIIEKLQQRSRNMASMYIPKSKILFYLRNLLMKLMPASWVASWHANAVKFEVDLTKS